MRNNIFKRLLYKHMYIWIVTILFKVNETHTNSMHFMSIFWVNNALGL